MTVDILEKEILELCTVDYVDLWFVGRQAARLFPDSSDEQRRYLILGALERLLVAGRVEAGYLEQPGEFVRWPLSPEQAIARIRRHWAEFGRPPQVSDIAWFQCRTSDVGDLRTALRISRPASSMDEQTRVHCRSALLPPDCMRP